MGNKTENQRHGTIPAPIPGSSRNSRPLGCGIWAFIHWDHPSEPGFGIYPSWIPHGSREAGAGLAGIPSHGKAPKGNSLHPWIWAQEGSLSVLLLHGDGNGKERVGKGSMENGEAPGRAFFGNVPFPNVPWEAERLQPNPGNADPQENPEQRMGRARIPCFPWNGFSPLLDPWE